MEKTENRELRITRTFNTSIDLMWEVWTDPNILKTGGDQRDSPPRFKIWTSKKVESGN